MASIRDLIAEINNTGVCLAVFVRRQVFESEAWTFLEFAKEDLSEISLRGRVNALSNAKRAVENRVDTLLHFFCLSAHAKRDRWNYPTKASKLRLAGVIVPDVLQNLITTARNNLEHDYKLPKDDREVSNCVDVADMFLRLTDPTISRGYLRWIVGPSRLEADYDVSSLKPNRLPQGAFGFLIDRGARLFRITLKGQSFDLKISDIDSKDIAESLRIIYAAITPDSTIILGPMSDTSFLSSYGW